MSVFYSFLIQNFKYFLYTYKSNCNFHVLIKNSQNHLNAFFLAKVFFL